MSRRLFCPHCGAQLLGQPCNTCGLFCSDEHHPKADPAIWVDGPDSEAKRAWKEDRGELVRLDPNQGVGFRSVEPSCGELGLELDVEGVRGTVYVSREMWEALGESMGWSGKVGLRKAHGVETKGPHELSSHVEIAVAEIACSRAREQALRAEVEHLRSGIRDLRLYVCGDSKPGDGTGPEQMVEAWAVVQCLDALAREDGGE